MASCLKEPIRVILAGWLHMPEAICVSQIALGNGVQAHVVEGSRDVAVSPRSAAEESWELSTMATTLAPSALVPIPDHCMYATNIARDWLVYAGVYIADLKYETTRSE